MGAWSAGIFGNDDALDWVYELEEEGAQVCLERTLGSLKSAAAGVMLEMPDCCIGLAAACVAAMLRGMPRPADTPPEVEQVMADAGFTPPRSMCQGYADVLDVALSERGEIVQPDVWGEEADLREWRGTAEEIRRFLLGEVAHG